MKSKWVRHLPWVVLLLFLAAPALTRNAYLTSLGLMIGVYGIIAMGLTILSGKTGLWSLGQAAFYGIGAYTSAVLASRMGLSFWLAMPLAVIAASACGFVIGLTSRRLVHPYYLAMVTVAFNIVFTVLVVQWVDLTGGVSGIADIPPPEIGSFRIRSDVHYFYLVWVVAVLLVLFTNNLVRSRIGRALAAIRDNETAAAVVGVQTSTYKLVAFTVAAAYAGMAGSLYAHYWGAIGPTAFSVGVSISLLVMLVLGGTESPWGALLGAGLVTLLPEGLRSLAGIPGMPGQLRSLLVDFSWQLILFGILMYVVVVFVPSGIAGLLGRLTGSELRAEAPEEERALTQAN